ncbi:MAG TPA: hypothetical protein VMF90_05995 [Rhizobiaceae bacterium]|nr:hypothetical protein [Rhizobiaceae bacterium]
MSDPMRAEQDRQTNEIYKILSDAVAAHGRKLQSEGRMPIANAVASAVVMMQGELLAGCADRRHRKALRNAMDRMLPEAIAACEGKVGRVGVYNVGARRQ